MTGARTGARKQAGRNEWKLVLDVAERTWATYTGDRLRGWRAGSPTGGNGFGSIEDRLTVSQRARPGRSIPMAARRRALRSRIVGRRPTVPGWESSGG
jgi:hypothetical protein